MFGTNNLLTNLFAGWQVLLTSPCFSHCILFIYFFLLGLNLFHVVYHSTVSVYYTAVYFAVFYLIKHNKKSAQNIKENVVKSNEWYEAGKHLWVAFTVKQLQDMMDINSVFMMQVKRIE